MARLRLRLLGGLEILDGQGRSVAPSAKKARALLAYLAMGRDQRQSRDRLATLLWEDRGEEQARMSLRQALSAIRRALPDAGGGLFEADGESVGLNVDALSVDALDLEAYLDDGGPEALEAALSLYEGDLLEGFMARAPVFEDWLRGEAERLRARALAAFGQLLDQQISAGDLDRAVTTASRLISLDPLQESVHRSLMRLYVRQGRQALALKQYRLCRGLLQRELGVTPEPATEKLYRDILHQRRTGPDTLSDEEGWPEAGQESDEETARGPRSELRAGPELRQVVVLSANLADFAHWTAGMEPEDIANLLNRYYERVDGAIEAFGGTVLKHVSDSVLAAFGVPSAHDNDPERACRAALELQSTLAGFLSESPDGPSLRVGLASGQVMVTELGSRSYHETSLTGDVMNRAALLASQAEAGGALLDSALRRSVGGTMQAIREGRLGEAGIGSGANGRESVWRLIGVLPGGGAERQIPLIGRELECQQFEGLLSAARDRGRGQLVVLRGEAGIGKSRLALALEDTAAGQGFTVHHGAYLDYGVEFSRNVVDAMIYSLLGLSKETAEEERRIQLDRLIELYAVSRDLRVFLVELLGLTHDEAGKDLLQAMDNAARGRGRRRAIWAVLRACASVKPILLVFEDVHWADPGDLGELASLGAEIKTLPAVMLMTSRSEAGGLDAAWRGATKGCPLTTVDLGPLDEEECRQLALCLVPRDEAFAEACVARADGNPLFLDQLLRHGQGDGDSLPGSIQSLVLAWMDKLEARDRATLQAASIVGQRFDSGVLACLLDQNCDATPLIDSSLVYWDGEAFVFVHALIRDAVYASNLKSQRRAMHMKLAEYYGQKDPGLHAEHLDRAEDEGACRAYLAAAHAALAAHRYEQALSLAERGLDICEDQRLRFEFAMLAGFLRRDFGAASNAIEAFDRALEYGASVRDRARALIGIASSQRILDRYDQALEVLDEAANAADAAGQHRILAEVHTLRGNIFFPQGRIDECLAAHRMALEVADRSGAPDLVARAQGGMGDAYYQRGAMITAGRHFGRCVELSRAGNLKHIEAAHLYMLGATWFYQNQVERAVADATASAAGAMALGDRRAEIVARSVLALALLYRGDYRRALEEACRGVTLVQRLGSPRFEGFVLAQLGLALQGEGEAAEAERTLDRAYDISHDQSASFTGPLVLGYIALVTADVQRRAWALSEGEKLLQRGCVSHNYLQFYRCAMEAALAERNWPEVLRFAAALEAYTAEEPLPWSDFYIARARTLAACGENGAGRDQVKVLARLRAQASESGLLNAIPAMEQALGKAS